MIDERDYVIRNYICGKTGKSKPQRWFMHYCDTCRSRRSYAPRNRGKLCASCAASSRVVSNDWGANISRGLKGNRNAAGISKLNSDKRAARKARITLTEYYASRASRAVARRVKKNCIDRLNRFVTGARKTYRWFSFDSDSLIRHLESKFKPGMTWNNYGRISNVRCWEIDHVIPLKAKNDTGYVWDQAELADPQSVTFKLAWSLENLQPLWADENLKKSNKIG